MAVIDPDGLFAGDRLRRCSNIAQLHWPRLFLASDGFGRLELNFARILGRAYGTFAPVPTEEELEGWIQEYAAAHLLFVYEWNGQVWGQWDTSPKFLPRHKTAHDKKSPWPPKTEFEEWKRSYVTEKKSFPKSFRKVSATFLRGGGVGVGGGVGKHIRAFENAQVCDAYPNLKLPSINEAPFDPVAGVGAAEVWAEATPGKVSTPKSPDPREEWFVEFWRKYSKWRATDKKRARLAFLKSVKTVDLFATVLRAVEVQTPEMLSRPPGKRPHATTWINGARWEDEVLPGIVADDPPTDRMLM